MKSTIHYISGKSNVYYPDDRISLPNEIKSYKNIVGVFCFSNFDYERRYILLKYFENFNSDKYEKINFEGYAPSCMYVIYCYKDMGRLIIEDVENKNSHHINNL